MAGSEASDDWLLAAMSWAGRIPAAKRRIDSPAPATAATYNSAVMLRYTEHCTPV